MKHIVIVRTSGSILNLSTYNCQELGLAKSLLKKGFRISLILAGEKYSEETIDGVNVIYCNFVSLNQQLSWFLNIESILNKLCPDVVQVHDMGVFMTWRVTLWAKKKKIPCFLIQGNYQETQKIFFRQLEMLFNKTFGTYVLHNVKGIGYKTLRASQYVKKYCARKTMATYIGLDVEKFVQADSIDWVGKLSLEGKKILLYVGSMEVRRNPLFLLDVVEGLSDEYILLLVGGGSLQDEIKTRIIESNLQSKCIYLGKLKQEELPSLYKISDLFLLASSYEIYGMVIMESMYFGQHGLQLRGKCGRGQ